MAGAFTGLRRLADYTSPATLLQLHRAGALDPKAPLAVAVALPWLLGRGPSLGILSQMNAFVLKDKAAIHDRNGSESFAELEQRANQAAHLLQDRGVTPGEHVALLLRNGREIAEISFAAQKLGVVVSPLNTWAAPAELKTLIESSRPRVLFYDTSHADQVEKSALTGIDLAFVGDPFRAIAGSLSYEGSIEQQPTSPPGPFTRDRGAAHIVIHTSGTTGTPKGAKRDSAAAGLGALANLLRVVPYRRDDVILCPAPLFHSFGLATFIVATALGATLVLPERFDPQGSLELIEKERATAASFVPVMIRRILSLPDDVKRRYDLGTLRVVMASGSTLPEHVRTEARALFGDILYDLYGSTEAGWVAIATPEDMKRRPNTVGRPTPGTEVAVMSPRGRRLRAGETGELFVKGEVAFEGYTSGAPSKSIAGFMSLGDLARQDEEGYLFIEGRADDMVVVGGENVYPIEVEQVIEGLEGVTEAAVVGLDDEEYGQVLAAVVEGSTDPEAVMEACRRQLASFKVPRTVVITDELPRTSTGKIVRRELFPLLKTDKSP